MDGVYLLVIVSYRIELYLRQVLAQEYNVMLAYYPANSMLFFVGEIIELIEMKLSA